MTTHAILHSSQNILLHYINPTTSLRNIMGTSCPRSSRIITQSPICFATNKLRVLRLRSDLVSSLTKKKTGLLCPPLVAERSTTLVTEDIGLKDLMSYADLLDVEEGIGIVRFLKGKTLLITGATGFLAKVLIEKILRTTPDVGKIYVVIKAKDKNAAIDRLKSEVINTELFRCLQSIHGKSYQSYMLEKLIPVVGDVREDDLGLEPQLADEISEEVDVIVNSAANTTFDERYDTALDINTMGPCRLMTFAKRFTKLKLFLQVSTAYVNGQRQGRVMEKTFGQGETIPNQASLKNLATSMPLLDIKSEIKMAFDFGKTTSDASSIQKMKEMGLERAKLHGWQDTYVFTKAMGEMMIDSMRGDIPVVTIRPSIIESTYKEPFPGWMEGNRMMDPIVLYYGKGQLNGFLADPNGVLDVVPADMVVNAILASMAKHGSNKDPGMHIYQIASSVTNPLVIQDLARILYEHFHNSPCMDSRGNPIMVPEMKLFGNVSDFSSYVRIDAVERSRIAVATITHEKLAERVQNLCMKSVEQANYLANIYEPYTFYGGRFDNTNTQMLMDELSEDEREEFGFDVRDIDWEDYISNIHIPGLRRHVMKGRGASSQVLKSKA